MMYEDPKKIQKKNELDGFTSNPNPPSKEKLRVQPNPSFNPQYVQPEANPSYQDIAEIRERLHQRLSQLTTSEARQEQADRLLASYDERNEEMIENCVKVQHWGIRRLLMAGFDQSILVRKSGFFSWLTSWKFTQKQIDKAKLPALDRINNGDAPGVLLREGYHKSEVDKAVSMRTTRRLDIKRAVMLACLLIGLPALMLLLL